MCFSKQLTKRVFRFENKKKLFFSFSLKNKKTKIENENSYQTWPKFPNEQPKLKGKFN